MNGNQPQQDEVELGGPGGLKFRARGYDVLTIFALALAAFIAWTLWELRANAAREHESIIKTQVVIEETVAEMTYILTLSQEERDKLDLAKPESLRKKTRR